MCTTKLWRRLTACAIATAVLLIMAPAAIGQDTTAIEEEWQLDVGPPNSSRHSPQLNCFISPVGNTDSYYAVLLVNQNSNGGGGLELQLWHGQSMVDSSSYDTSTGLDTVGERVQWTTRMSVDNKGLLTVQVISGSSTSWGRFGGKNDLIVSAATSLKNLNGYNSSFTTDSSGVEYGHRRVSKLTLRKIRVYSGNKKSVEQAVDRVVHETK